MCQLLFFYKLIICLQVAFFSIDTLAEVPAKKIRAPKDVKFSAM
jgi:hypothetical protein